jgi:predicted ribosomally synthesized peptide with SipW-like signal peptide
MAAPPPAPGHTRDFEELAGLAALQALEGDELADFQAHARGCQRCQAIERADREAVALLGLAAPEMDASPGFKERLMQRAAAELGAREPAIAPEPEVREPEVREPIPLRPRVVPFRRSAWVASLAAVFVIALAGAGTYSYLNQVVTSVPLSGSTSGQAVVQVKRSGAATLQMRGLPTPPAGYVYEAWIIPQGAAPVPAGTTPSGQADLPLSGQVVGTTVAITQEVAPGVNAPTSTPILAAPVVS